ncbi:MAG: ATP synthase F1 subunit epsilon [Pirellulales bacterium]
MSDLQCVVVTPEKTEVDVRATSVTVPLFDGEMGILKGHSPLVGRLGYGLLRMQVGGETQRYFIEEGLIQVDKDVVSILTDKVTPVSKITADVVAKATEAAQTMPVSQASEIAARKRALERARALSRVAGN